MLKKSALIFLAVALMATPAFAAKKKDTYNLKGALSAYTAAVDESTPGSVTILVSKANKAGRPFVGQTLTFVVPFGTKVKTDADGILDGDVGNLLVQGAPGLDATGLQALTPKLVVEQNGS
jgi:hypothetical protein